MINLRNVDTKDLINELLIREGVRSMNIENDEDGTRYLRGYGPSIILEIKI